jgi:hypothetical protein
VSSEVERLASWQGATKKENEQPFRIEAPCSTSVFSARTNGDGLVVVPGVVRRHSDRHQVREPALEMVEGGDALEAAAG